MPVCRAVASACGAWAVIAIAPAGCGLAPATHATPPLALPPFLMSSGLRLRSRRRTRFCDSVPPAWAVVGSAAGSGGSRRSLVPRA
jgi:hypothetical protein